METPLPAIATVPAISWPGHATGIIISSWYQCRSDPQMPHAATATTTSPGPGSGRSTSSTTTRPGPSAFAARMRVITIPYDASSPPRVMLEDRFAHAVGERIAVVVLEARGRTRRLGAHPPKAGAGAGV